MSLLNLDNYNEGTTIPSLRTETLYRLEFDIPSLQDQERILSILKSLDDKIEVNSQINKNLEEQMKQIYDSRFVTFEHYKHNITYGELGKQPINWEVTLLKNVTQNIRTRVEKATNIKVLSALNSGKLSLSEEYFTKQVFSKDISKYILVEKNDFAYNPARVNIGSIGINDLDIRGCVSPVYVVIRTEKDYENYFNYFIKTDRFKTEVKTRASGSVRQAMNYTDFGLIKIIYPPKNEVIEFNAIIEPLIKTIKHLTKENTELIMLRDMLLPKLMSGEIDVSEIDI